MSETQKQNKLEFFYKKNSYLFPQQSNVYADGNNIFVEVSGQRINDLSKYIKPQRIKSTKYKLVFAISLLTSEIYKSYQNINEYLKNNLSLDMMTFDYDLAGKLSLCSFLCSEETAEYKKLENEINDSLSHLINIFMHPVTHLKSLDEILPIDAVKRVTNTSIHHFMTHTRYWDNSTSGKVKPRNLLTKVYDDNYSIYENVVFKELIDKILFFLLKRINSLCETLSVLSVSLQFDSLNNFNHAMYYLAIGRLYVGLSKSQNRQEIKDQLNRTKSIYNSLIGYKKCKVYTKNISRKINSNRIKQTNLFSMHKDYAHIYRLYNAFNAKLYKNNKKGDAENQLKSQQYYQEFCKLMLLFSLKHFNFDCDPKDIIYKNKTLSAKLRFECFDVVVNSKKSKTLDFDLIEMRIKSDQTIKVLFVPFCYHIFGDKKNAYSNIIDRLFANGEKYDKYVFLEPFEIEKDSAHSYHLKSIENQLLYAILPVSINEVNSFRRIQKIIFEAMIKSQTNDCTCAFCGNQLQYKDNTAFCKKCSTVFEKIHCDKCKKNFVGTYASVDFDDKKENKPYLNSSILEDEKNYSFRDIVRIKSKNYLCPHCDSIIKITNPPMEKHYEKKD